MRSVAAGQGVLRTAHHQPTDRWVRRDETLRLVAAIKLAQALSERAGNIRRIESFDQARRVVDLPARVAQEAPELLLDGSVTPVRLLLECSERPELTSRLDLCDHLLGTERTDQLVLEVFDASVEAEPFDVGSREAGSESRPLKTSAEIGFLRLVVQPGQVEA